MGKTEKRLSAAEQIREVETFTFIVEILREKYRCHSAILYGSRARGEQRASSDYDVAGFKEGASKTVRDANRYRGQFLDLFIYSTASKDFKAVLASEEIEKLADGVVLFEAGRAATKILKLAQRKARKRPALLPKSEVVMRQSWALKTFTRAQHGDAEGHFRRIWLVQSLLLEYFALRRERYEGPKKSLARLAAHNPSLFKLYSKLLKAPHSERLLKKAIQKMLNVTF